MADWPAMTKDTAQAWVAPDPQLQIDEPDASN